MKFVRNILIKIFLFTFFIIENFVAHGTEEDHIDFYNVDVYSDKTTKYVLLSKEKRYLNNTYSQVDHSKDYIFLHRFKYRSNSRDFYQNLGINGTPSKLLYYLDAKKHLGYNLGYADFDSYFDDFDKSVFFDTKSPYADFKVDLARYGSFYFDGTYSRNINKDWNIGLSYKLYTSQREFFENNQLDTSDRVVISNGLRIFSSAELFEKKYRVFASFSIMKRKMRELGGIFAKPDRLSKNFFARTDKEEMYLNSEERVQDGLEVYNRISPFQSDGYKSSPETINFKISGNIYQDYKILDKFHLYNDLTVYTVSNFFEYRNRQKDSEGYPTKTERKGKKYKPLNFKDDAFEEGDKKILKGNLAFLGINFDERLSNYTYYQDVLTISNEFGFIHTIDKFTWVPYYRLSNHWIAKSAGDGSLNNYLSEDYLNNF